MTASDVHPLAEAFLHENLRLNAMLPLHYRHGPWDGEPSPAGFDLRDPLVGRFDLIIGSDVLYERDDGGQLPRFIERHAQPDACVLIVDPDRGNRSAFNRRMLALGFALRESRLDRRARGGDAGYKGRLLCFERPWEGPEGPCRPEVVRPACLRAVRAPKDPL